MNYRNLSIQSSESQQSESHGSSNEWIKPKMDEEWRAETARPRPRPPSKHVSHINHTGDAMIAILADSTTATSSSEEKSPSHPCSSGSSSRVNAMAVTTPTTTTPQGLPIMSSRREGRPATALNRTIVAPNRIMTAPNRLTPHITQSPPEDDSPSSPKRDLSPVIVKETITTGSTNRYEHNYMNNITKFTKSSMQI